MAQTSKYASLLILCLCFCAIVAALPTRSSNSFAQTRRRQIPEVEVPCTPEESKWWDEIREIGIEVQKSRGAKHRRKFLELLKLGREQSYKPPLLDRSPTVLAMFQPKYSETARRNRLSGRILMQVEFQSNGAIGEVVIVHGLRSDLDNNAAEAARMTAFLPAVKDREFVTVWKPMEMSFQIH